MYGYVYQCGCMLVWIAELVYLDTLVMSKRRKAATMSLCGFVLPGADQVPAWRLYRNHDVLVNSDEACTRYSELNPSTQLPEELGKRLKKQAHSFLLT